MADPGTEKVYDWEDDWTQWNYNSLTLAGCRELIRTAAAKYDLPPPTVKQHNVRSLSWCIPTRNQISLQARGPDNRGGKNAATALHEAAHYIAWHYFGNRIDDHGPTWLGIYLWLLEAAEVAPPLALHATARARGLRWRHMPPNLVKKHGRHSPKR